jgi:rod shape-determining protein MreD
MRWVTFLVLAVVVLTLQSVVAPRLELLGARPDWLLVVVVFFALRAAPRDAVLGAWVLGACADLMTIERFGLLALSYGLAGAAVTSVREYLFRSRPLTQFVVTLLVCLLLRFAWLLYRRMLYDPAGSLLVDMAIDVVTASVYTAAWAPVWHAVLGRMPRTFGLPRPRYTFAGLRRMGAADV